MDRQYPPHTQSNDIDPRLQEASQDPQSSSTSAAGIPSNQYRLPTLPPHIQQQQQPPYTNASWPQDGYNPYYPSDQPNASIPLMQPQQNYQNFQENSGALPSTVDADSKRTRACEACRGLKVKCEPDPNNGPCKRCIKANRQCVITPPSRKRQKKTDSRVAELERKIDALTATLHAAKEGHVSGSEDGSYANAEDNAMASTPQPQPSHSVFDGTNRKRRLSRLQHDAYSAPPQEITAAAIGQDDVNRYRSATAEILPARSQAKMQDFGSPGFQNAGSHEGRDVIQRGIVPFRTAQTLFAHYANDMAPHMPLVPIPSNMSAEMLRATKPVLFLALLSVASAQDYQQMHVALKGEVMHTLADKIFVKGETSLELIQALHVVTIWYWPPSDGDSKYFQFVHMALLMAIDLGIDKRQHPRRGTLIDIPGHRKTYVDTESLECKRAWLGCYLLASSIAMGKRRASLVRPDGYLEECITKVENSDDLIDLVSKRTLTHWVRLQILADELSTHLLPDEHFIMSEAKARAAFKTFESQLKEWELAKNGDLGASSLSLAFNVVKLYMHELLMHHESSPESQKLPRGRGSNSNPSESFSLGYTATLGILDSFISLSVPQGRSVPIFQFAQLAHAGIALIKMHFVGKSHPEFFAQAPITQANVETYLSRITELLKSAAADGKSVGAHTFLMVFQSIQTMFDEHKTGDLAAIRARYGGVPSTKAAQILDLEEPNPIPMGKRTRAQEENAKGGLQLLSEVAMGKSGNNGGTYTPEPQGQSGMMDFGSAPPQQPFWPVGEGDMTAVGQLIGDGDLGFLSDEGIFGIMQTMWSRSI